MVYKVTALIEDETAFFHWAMVISNFEFLKLKMKLFELQYLKEQYSEEEGYSKVTFTS